MAFWPSSATSNDALVDNLRKAGVVQSLAVEQAMRCVDRAQYMQRDSPLGVPVGPATAYCDAPHPIGFNQTISAPHMHAHALELTVGALTHQPDRPPPRVLDVGAGSGYLTACLGRLVGPLGGRVIGLEVLAPLAQFAKKNLEHADGDLLDQGVVAVVVGNGWDGLPNEAPFDVIHVGAAADRAPPALLDQLAPDGGTLIVPLDQDRGGQILTQITRRGDTYDQRRLMNVCYVPLVRPRKPSV